MDKAEVAKREKKDMKKIEEFMAYELNKAPTSTLYIQHKGVWDMDGLLKTVAEFFTQNKYRFYEKLQRHRHPGPFGVERDYLFSAYRNVEEHQRWNMHVRLETFDEHDIEVTLPDGAKKMMAAGRLWIQINAWVDVDYDKRWEKSWIALNLRKFMARYVIRKRIELPWWDKMYYSTLVKLHGIIIEKLKFESRIDEHRHMAGVH